METEYGFTVGFNPAQASLKSRRTAGCKTFAGKIFGACAVNVFIFQIWQGWIVMKAPLYRIIHW